MARIFDIDLFDICYIEKHKIAVFLTGVIKPFALFFV